MRKIAAIVAVAGVAGLAACEPTPVQEPREVVEAFSKAVLAGDVQAAQALLAPDVLVYEFGSQEASRDEYAAGHLKADMAFLAAATVQTLDRRDTVSGNMAVVMTRSRISGQYKDKPFDQLSTETMVLRNAGGTWRITHIHWSSRAVPKS